MAVRSPWQRKRKKCQHDGAGAIVPDSDTEWMVGLAKAAQQDRKDGAGKRASDTEDNIWRKAAIKRICQQNDPVIPVMTALQR